MNKYSLGTIVGAALLGLSKKWGSKSEAVMIKPVEVHLIYERLFVYATFSNTISKDDLTDEQQENIDRLKYQIRDLWEAQETEIQNRINKNFLSKLQPKVIGLTDASIDLNTVFEGDEFNVELFGVEVWSYPILQEQSDEENSNRIRGLHYANQEIVNLGKRNADGQMNIDHKDLMEISINFLEEFVKKNMHLFNQYLGINNEGVEVDFYETWDDAEEFTDVKYIYLDKDGNEAIPHPENLMKLRDR
jgi:hypothetical protein